VTNRFLLDTQALLFLLNGDAFPLRVQKLFMNSGAEAFEFFWSTASLWAMAIKASKHSQFALEQTFDEVVMLFQGAGARRLDAQPAHFEQLRNLPWHHKDLFDRLIIAQAKAEGLTLIGADRVFTQYGVPVLWD
jgi:PIN domain nuclease of toxin-antitoxin system